MAHIGFLHALRGLQPSKSYQLTNDELWTLINKAGIKLKSSKNQEENIKMFKSPQNYQDFVDSHIHNTINQTKRKIKNQLNDNLQNWLLAPCEQQPQSFFSKKKKRFEDSFPIILKEIDEQINCSICLEIFVHPVLTPCGHAFCYECMDNHLLVKTTCPICREDIKNTKFKIDVTLDDIVGTFISNCDDPEKVNKYEQRLQKGISWRKGREVTLNNLQIGSKIDIRDTETIWCKGQILNIYYKDNEIEELLVHYDKWHRLYDEVIYVPSIRLAPYGYFTNRTNIICYNLRQTQDNLRGSVVSPQNRASAVNYNDAMQQQEQEDEQEANSENSSQSDINELQQQAISQFSQFVRHYNHSWRYIPQNLQPVFRYPYRLLVRSFSNNFSQTAEERSLAASANEEDNFSIRIGPAQQQDSNMEQEARDPEVDY